MSAGNVHITQLQLSTALQVSVSHRESATSVSTQGSLTGASRRLHEYKASANPEDGHERASHGVSLSRREDPTAQIRGTSSGGTDVSNGVLSRAARRKRWPISMTFSKGQNYSDGEQVDGHQGTEVGGGVALIQKAVIGEAAPAGSNLDCLLPRNRASREGDRGRLRPF